MKKVVIIISSFLIFIGNHKKISLFKQAIKEKKDKNMKLYVFVLSVSTIFFVDVYAMSFNDKESLKYPLIFQAIDDNNLDKVKELCENSETSWMIEQRWGEKTPLIYAITEKNSDIAKYLIKKGANLKCKNAEDYTPLHCASLTKNIAVAQLLLQKGADIEAVTIHGETPLSRSIVAERSEFEMAQLLVQQGASIFAKSDGKCFIDGLYEFKAQGEQRYYVDILVFEAFKYMIGQDNKNRFKELVNYPSKAIKEKINTQDKSGNTLLHLVMMSEPKILRNAKARLLLACDASPNVCNNAGVTPVHIAVQQNDLALFGLLVAYKADILMPFPKQLFHPMHMAIHHHPRMLTLLTRAARG